MERNATILISDSDTDDDDIMILPESTMFHSNVTPSTSVTDHGGYRNHLVTDVATSRRYDTIKVVDVNTIMNKDPLADAVPIPKPLQPVLQSLPGLNNNNMNILQLVQIPLKYMPNGTNVGAPAPTSLFLVKVPSSAIQSTILNTLKNSAINLEGKTTPTMLKFETNPPMPPLIQIGPEPPVPLPPPPKQKTIPYQCVSMKKHNYKMDMEGFTFNDRLGFYKAEVKRAKRCVYMLSMHVKIRSVTLEKLEKRRQINMRKNGVFAIPPALSEADRIAYWSNKYKLKECRISLSATVVPQYFDRRNGRRWHDNTRNKFKYQISNNNNDGRGVPLRRLMAHNIKQLNFIGETNFQKIEKIDGTKHNYFINTHDVITTLYMKAFPSFKQALESNKIEMVHKSIFQRFEANVEADFKAVFKNKKSLKFATVPKYYKFCDIVNEIRQSSNLVLLEHNYFTQPMSL